ncbi:flagellar hook capping FlgD N-terminal domain-containing protein [Desulfoscipio gibsoniae]|uniref:Basal-body rod modification protein FlgD n=1 Tax=Desulfoscipio gibsoniae DSM 7213 TaxID=767817 RepID=R4KEM8_9FIRM|nr:flagellar hook capping FlgD N-terminal domain-containing protein [Desulfoscipio gibsoniae]AGL01653.1 flagellar hook capping protein [Desulfoscipio gibsoniae DSM 7213]
MTDPISIKNDYYLPSDNEVKNPPQSMADPDIFLKILVAQMQYQDPMNPQDSSAFISQLSQMASMEQMYNVSRSMDSMASRYETANYYNLLGKNVTVLSEDKEKIISGQVGGILFDDQKPYFYIDNNPNGPLYSLEQIIQVAGNETSDFLSNALLVDRLVKVRHDNEEISGLVEKVLIQNGQSLIQVNGRTYGMDQLIEVGRIIEPTPAAEDGTTE